MKKSANEMSKAEKKKIMKTRLVSSSAALLRMPRAVLHPSPRPSLTPAPWAPSVQLRIKKGEDVSDEEPWMAEWLGTAEE